MGYRGDGPKPEDRLVTDILLDVVPAGGRHGERGIGRYVRGLVKAALDLPDGYESEIGFAAEGWVRSVVDILDTGVLLLIDYGFPAAELYHPQRATGTLMCHYRHYAHADPFLHPGLQDITTHVDFSAVSRAAGSVGLDALGYTSQAHLLLNLGLLEHLARTPAEQAARYLPQSQAVQRLVSESEMGELFKAIAFGRGVADEAIGFSRGDRRGSL